MPIKENILPSGFAGKREQAADPVPLMERDSPPYRK
jgi:hypothetical protein